MAETKSSPPPADEEQPLSVPIAASSSNDNTDYDHRFFHQIVEDAGRWAYGVIFVEVWVLNEDRTQIFRPECGWWIDNVATDFGENTKFARLTDPALPDFLPPAPLAPGVGLAGALWSETAQGNAATNRRISSTRPSMFSGGNTQRENDTGRFDTNREGQRRTGLLARTVAWRQVQPLCDDPDQPYNPRLQYLGEIGLGWAAGVPFQVGSTEGIVIYMARDTTDQRKLQAPENQDYLTHASLVIGSAYALRHPRLVVEDQRKAEKNAALDRLRTKVRLVMKMNKNLKEFVDEEENKITSSPTAGKPGAMVPAAKEEAGCSDFFVRKIQISIKKFFGAANKAPATFTWEQTAWTFCGSFFTLCALTTLNRALITNYGVSHGIVLGPFGALMTLQYGLTAAPASQPRNAIMGQFIGLFIAHGVGQAVNLDLWLKQSLATALAISCMVKLGVTHPPAGAAALLFSNGLRTWQQIGMMFLGNVIAILCATFVNNLNERRQYPTFWGFEPVLAMMRDEEEEEAKTAKKKA